MKTKAAILFETKKDLVIDEIEIPTLNSGQVLVKINYSGICGTQIAEIFGDKGEDRWVPHCLGHEATGVVVDKGIGVTKVNIDDKVVLSWIKGSGIDAGGCKYKLNSKDINAGPITTLQDFAIISENRLTIQPKNLDDITSVILGCAAPTGMGSIYNVLKAEYKSKVVIIGAGGIGLCACLACKEKKINEISFIEPNKNRQKLALLFGASEILEQKIDDTKDSNFNKHQNSFDYAIESSGKIESINVAINLIKNQGGRSVIIGNAPFGSNTSFPAEIFNKGKSLLGTWGGDCNLDRDLNIFSKIIVSNKDKIKSLFSRPYKLSNVNKAVHDFKNGKIGRPIISLNQE